MQALLRYLFALLLSCPLAPLVHAAPSAQDILAASDLVRNPDFPFGLTNTLIEYRNGKEADSSSNF